MREPKKLLTVRNENSETAELRKGTEIILFFLSTSWSSNIYRFSSLIYFFFYWFLLIFSSLSLFYLFSSKLFFLFFFFLHYTFLSPILMTFFIFLFFLDFTLSSPLSFFPSATRWFRDPKVAVPLNEITRFPHAVLEVSVVHSPQNNYIREE